MHARAASIVLLGLGILDLGALNLLLAPRLASISAATAPSLPRDEGPAPVPPTWPEGVAAPAQAPAPGGTRASAEVWVASVSASAAGTARTGRAAPDVPFSSDSTVV